MQRRLLWATAGFTACVIGCCIIGLAMLLPSWGRPLHTHEDTVAYMLERRKVAYTRIVLTQSYEESVDFDTYRARVQVVTAAGRVANGWIGCEDRDRVCFLELREVGIRGEALPELQPKTWPAWIDWLLLPLRERGLN